MRVQWTATTATANAQFSIPWSTIDGGGGQSTGGEFQVNGTIGQHDAGNTMSGGSFTLSGGFWAGGDFTDVLLGDVNGDGVVDLQDVAPFVDLLTSGEFLAEADINQDGEVNLQDVAPFVELLTGR